jgi:hypothetical protein
MNLFPKACTVLALLVLVGCGGADSGNGGGGEETASSEVKTVTHSGTITNVNADDRKITVDLTDNGTKKFSLGKSTVVLERFKEVPFDSLAVDQQVGVEVEEGSSTPREVNIAKK